MDLGRQLDLRVNKDGVAAIACMNHDLGDWPVRPEVHAVEDYPDGVRAPRGPDQDAVVLRSPSTTRVSPTMTT